MLVALLFALGGLLGPSCREAPAASAGNTDAAAHTAASTPSDSATAASAAPVAAQVAPQVAPPIAAQPSAPSADDDLPTLAAAALPAFLDAAWPQRDEYGFREDDDRAHVALGRPWIVQAIDADVAAAWRAGAPLIDALVPAGEWIFPVEVEGAARTLFGMRPFPDGWRGVYLGNPLLAESLAGIRAAWERPGGGDPILVSCTEPRAFFFTVAGWRPETLTPITHVSAGSAGDLAPPTDWRDVSPAPDTLDLLEHLWSTVPGH